MFNFQTIYYWPKTLIQMRFLFIIIFCKYKTRADYPQS